MTFKWWPLRRLSQLCVIALIASPLFGMTFFSGNLSAAELFGFGLADPLAFLQASLAGRLLLPSFLGAALIVAGCYFAAGGRTFCGWICPVYLATESADKLRRRLGTGDRTLPLSGGRWLLAATLILSMLTALPLFEMLSPIGATSRALMFQDWQPLLVLLAIVLVEVAVARRVWCRSLCPVGGFYALLGRFSPLRVRFSREACNGCGECCRLCPVEEVLQPVLQGAARQVSSGDCTRCGACIDVCQPKALGVELGYRSSSCSSKDCQL
jgi:ferredoxin-type protein NapH